MNYVILSMTGSASRQDEPSPAHPYIVDPGQLSGKQNEPFIHIMGFDKTLIPGQLTPY